MKIKWHPGLIVQIELNDGITLRQASRNKLQNAHSITQVVVVAGLHFLERTLFLRRTAHPIEHAGRRLTLREELASAEDASNPDLASDILARESAALSEAQPSKQTKNPSRASRPFHHD